MLLDFFRMSYRSYVLTIWKQQKTFMGGKIKLWNELFNLKKGIRTVKKICMLSFSLLLKQEL